MRPIWPDLPEQIKVVLAALAFNIAVALILLALASAYELLLYLIF